MGFAGKVWRLLVGIKDGLVLILMLLFFSALFAILTARPSPGAVREGALVMDLSGIIVEERSEVDPFAALLSQQAPVGEFQSRDLVRALDAAATDERIEAVVLDLEGFLGAGQVHLTEVGAALDRVRANHHSSTPDQPSCSVQPADRTPVQDRPGQDQTRLPGPVRVVGGQVRGRSHRAANPPKPAPQ